MANKQEVRVHQESFLNKLKERRRPTPYTIEGVDILVNPDVFPPATDTRLLAAHIQTRPGERFADLTTGSGIIAIIAGRQGATGFAVDIIPAAVTNAEQNLARHNLTGVQPIESNLFENVLPEQFDWLFANGPFVEGEITDPLDYACYGTHEFIEGLLTATRKRLKPDGKLLTVLAEWSDLEHFERTAQKNQLAPRLVATRHSDDGERRYRLYEVAHK